MGDALAVGLFRHFLFERTGEADGGRLQLGRPSRSDPLATFPYLVFRVIGLLLPLSSSPASRATPSALLRITPTASAFYSENSCRPIYCMCRLLYSLYTMHVRLMSSTSTRRTALCVCISHRSAGSTRASSIPLYTFRFVYTE